MPVEDPFIVDESDQSEFDDELGEVQHDYANPLKVMERARKLESIPFDLVNCQSPSPAAQGRINRLEAHLRHSKSSLDRKYIGTNISLQSSFLKHPSVEGWPAPDSEESDIEYFLHETEEDWFTWKREVDLIRARKALKYPGNARALSCTSPPFSRYGTPSSELFPSRGSTSRTVSFVTVFDDSKSPVGKLTLAIDWNQNSFEGADSSMPPQPLVHPVSQIAISQPSTPPRQLASPPDSGFQPPKVLPIDLRTPSRPTGTNQTSVCLSNQATISPITQITRVSQETRNPPDSCTPVISSQAQLTPLTPLSPKIVSRNKQASSRLTSPSPLYTPAYTRASHPRKDRSKTSSHSSRQTTPRSNLQPQLGSRKSGLQEEVSPATTYFLYGSQTEGSPITHSKPENQCDTYGQELEQERILIDKQRSSSSETVQSRDLGPTEGRAVSTSGTSRVESMRRIPSTGKLETSIDRWSRGLWDIDEGREEDDMQYVSQEAREISGYIGDDLGDFYRDETYHALGKFPSPAYFDPYSL
ncbi:hypothetical protein FS842_006717 [Serendipita sp. 407]|nr:hypothetical protein FS842_006717 [Serendipita sp. 407]